MNSIRRKLVVLLTATMSIVMRLGGPLSEGSNSNTPCEI